MSDERLAELWAMYNRRLMTSAVEEYCPDEFGELLTLVGCIKNDLACMVKERDYWRELCREAIHEGQRAQRLAKEWQDIAEGAG